MGYGYGDAIVLWNRTDPELWDDDKMGDRMITFQGWILWNLPSSRSKNNTPEIMVDVGYSPITCLGP